MSDVIFVGLGGIGDVYWAFILFLFTLFIILFISCFPYYKLVSGARGISRAALCGGGYGILLDRVVKKRISREWAYRGFKETGRDKKMNWVRSGYYVGLMMASVVCIIMGVQFLPK